MAHRSSRAMAMLVAALLPLSLFSARAQTAPPPPAITAQSAIVVDGWTGHVLYALRPDEERAPASTVKMMTALLVLLHHVPLHEQVSVSSFAASYGGSTAGLWAGERLSLWSLMHGMMLPSGNDAAVAVSETLSPTIAGFAAMMNQEAARLHMWHTHYLTANGFDTPGQVITARDEATLARYAMQFPRFVRLVRTRVWTVRQNGVAVHVWRNLNQLLWWNRAVDGVKTGTTDWAGACLVSSVMKDGRWVIAVNLGSTEAQRYNDGMKLLNYGLAYGGVR